MAELSCDRTAGGDCHSLRDGIARQLSDSPWHLEDSAWTAGEYILFAVMIVSMVRFLPPRVVLHFAVGTLRPAFGGCSVPSMTRKSEGCFGCVGGLCRHSGGFG
jgi:hypothetical protein